MKESKTLKVIGIILGVLTVILGVYGMFIPGRVFLSVGWMLGILLFASGIQMLVVGLKAEKKDVVSCILGVLCIIGGIILFFSGVQRLFADSIIIWLLAFGLICFGVFQIINGVQLRKQEGKGGVLEIVLGVLSIIVGILAAGHPIITAISTGFIIAWDIILQGINIILLSMGKK